MYAQEERLKVVRTEPEATRAQRAFVRPLLAVVCVVLASGASALAQEARRGLDAIEHVVVIYVENRSFDHLFGLFPGANGIAHATNPTQVDHDGTPLPYLTIWKGGNPDPAFPTHLPNKPFRLDGDPVYRPMSVPTGSIVHRFYHNQEQINGGRNDRFVAVSDAGGLAMGYYDGAQLAMWKWAQEYTLADNFFMAAFGGSYLISPYAKRGYVDHTPYDTTSIIKFITRRFALEPLPGVRDGAGDLLNAFDFVR